MKKNTKIFNILLLFIFIFSLCLSLKTSIFVYKFNPNEVKKHIEYLSSDRLKGRLPGTIENHMAEQYVKSQFEHTKLMPAENGSYMQTFKIKYPCKIENEKPYLTIVDKNNNVVKNFKYGKDFKEDMLNFKVNTINFNRSNSSFTSEGIKAVNGKNSVIFYCAPNELNFRSSFVVDAPFSMYVMITKDTLMEIYKEIKKGSSVNCYIPYTIKEAYVNNVVGKIQGKNKNLSPIVIGAHLDHVGTDFANNVYNGALDNASGMSFIMEMSKYIKSLGKPDRDIIFVGFNGEEFGFLGSSAFVKRFLPDLTESKVFNFDMIGGNKSVPLCIMGSKKDSNGNTFVKSISDICSHEKIHYKCLFEDASDHKPFRDQNIDAISFCDNDTSKIHTPNDKINFIEEDSINRCFRVSSKVIKKYAFKNNIFVTHYNLVIIISSLGIILTSYHLISQRKKSIIKK